MNLEELVQAVEKWGTDRKIIEKGTPLGQLTKTKEEIEEIEECINNLLLGNESFIDSKQRQCNTLESLQEEVGDLLVTTILLSKVLKIDLKICLEKAYNKISKRKGKMVDGIFVKDSY